MAHEPAIEAKKGTRNPWGSVLVWLLASAAFLAPLIAGKLEPFGPGIIRILIFLAALVFLASVHRQGTVCLPNRAVLRLSAILLVLGIASFAGVTSIHATLFAVLDLAGFLIAFLLVTSLGERDVYRVLGALLASGLLVAVLGIREYLYSPAIDWRVFSTFFNPDFLAGFMALVLPLALAWYLSETPVTVSVAAGISVLAILGALLLTGSRFGVAAALGGLVVFAALALTARAVKKPQVVRLALIVLPVIFVVLTLGRPLFSRVTSAQAQSHSGGFRIATWKGTLRMARAHPLTGTGLGTFELAYPRYAEVGFTKLAHNSYLQLAAEAGVGAPIVVILLIGVALAPPMAFLWRRRRAGTPDQNGRTARDWMPDRSLMLSGIVGGAAASCARSLVDSDWYVVSIGVSFAVILGAGMALASAPRRTGMTVGRTVAGSLSGALSIFILGSLISAASAPVAKRGDALLHDRDVDKAVSAYKTALVLDPLNPEYCRALGQAYTLRAADTGNPDDLLNAARYLMLAVKREPTSARNRYQLGRFYEFAGKDGEALKAYQESLERDPNAVTVLLAQAGVYERMGRDEDALKAYRRMTEIENSPYERIRAMPEFVEPAYVFAHYALGMEYERKGDRDAAVLEYRRALGRIRAYEKSLKVVGPILDASGRRDPGLESQLGHVRRDIMRRLRTNGRFGTIRATPSPGR